MRARRGTLPTSTGGWVGSATLFCTVITAPIASWAAVWNSALLLAVSSVASTWPETNTAEPSVGMLTWSTLDAS